MIVHLNGWPGVGKKAIGEVLSRKLNARFVHNHLLHDVAIVCAGLNDLDRWELYESVRRAAYDVLARRPPSETFVMTGALCTHAAREQDAWRHVVDLAIARQVSLVPVVLEISLEENIRRIQSPERHGRKMTDAAELRSMQAVDSIQRPDVPERIDLEVSALPPEAAADRICARLDAIRPSLRPATLGHLVLR